MAEVTSAYDTLAAGSVAENGCWAVAVAAMIEGIESQIQRCFNLVLQFVTLALSKHDEKILATIKHKPQMRQQQVPSRLHVFVVVRCVNANQQPLVA